MKALTLWQPWASLVALGVKTIETRSWATSIRGEIAIHAAAKRPPHGGYLGDWYVEPWWYEPRHVVDCCCEDGEIDVPCARRSRPSWVMTNGDGRRVDLPLGGVIATCTVADVAPCVDFTRERTDERIRVEQIDETLWLRVPGVRPALQITDQLPYGDFAPGQFAWLLEKLKPLPEPVPARGAQRWWEWSR